jgi:hypothetical protein
MLQCFICFLVKAMYGLEFLRGPLSNPHASAGETPFLPEKNIVFHLKFLTCSSKTGVSTFKTWFWQFSPGWFRTFSTM